MILDSLNPAQQQAVAADAPQVLVLAGAGSGKTRVLAHRVGWLIEQGHCRADNVLAVTFTNKAAREMRSRIETLIGHKPYQMWVGTFHGLAHRFLRAHSSDAGLPEHFQILDSEDQLTVIKRILKELKIDDDRYPPRKIQWFINGQKEQGRRADNAHLISQDHYHNTLLDVYRHYEEWCERTGVVDFAELLLRTFETLRDTPALLQHYQERFTSILIDEFQDTNYLQYAWIRLLAGANNHLFMVGDDDQSIYSWRGAQIENIHRFSKDFPDSITIRLEQNYRSTQTILSAANALIANNESRLGKELWTELGEGEPIKVYNAFNETDEARFICGRIKAWIEQGNLAAEAAILYRSNAQSRVIEEALLHAGIHYKIYGGLRFFERAEIKDAMAYARLIQHHQDDAAFERIVNTPTRGVGEAAKTVLRDLAKAENISLWAAAEKTVQESLLPTRARNAVAKFLDMMNEMTTQCQKIELHEQMTVILSLSGLIAHYENERSEKARTKLENLRELVTACAQFHPQDDYEKQAPMAAFISQASLDSEPATEEQAQERDCVQLMTLHSAKGLEFPLVFIAGLETGLFPHYMSVDSPAGLEEERRLCYVGMTRAMKELYLTYADVRRLHGTERVNQPSSFLSEIPKHYLQWIRMQQRIQRPAGQARIAATPMQDVQVGDFTIGASVRHPVFGDGIITNFEGSGGQTRVQVEFDQAGAKWLVAAFAKLEAI